MKARYQSGLATEFYAVELTYPGFTLRLAEAGFVTIEDEDYLAGVAGRGHLLRADKLRAGGGEVAPRWRVTLAPDGFAAEAPLVDPAAQGGRVRVWQGTLDRDSGLPDGDPSLVFLGEMDTATTRIDGSGFEVEIDCCSGLDLGLEALEGHALNDAFHQGLFPGELGFDAATGVDDPVYWGVSPPRSSIVGQVPSSGFLGRLFGGVRAA